MTALFPSFARRALLGLAIAASLTGCAAPPERADPALLSRIDVVLRQADPARATALILSTSQVKTGEALAADIRTAAGGHAYVFQLGTDGRSLSLVFPNSIDGANFTPAGSTLQLPRPNWKMSTKGPAGIGYLIAVVTEQPLDLMALQAELAKGQLMVSAPYGAALAPYREVAP